MKQLNWTPKDLNTNIIQPSCFFFIFFSFFILFVPQTSSHRFRKEMRLILHIFLLLFSITLLLFYSNSIGKHTKIHVKNKDKLNLEKF
jgi:cell division protein FtsW (lipid II flippase)